MRQIWNLICKDFQNVKQIWNVICKDCVRRHRKRTAPHLPLCELVLQVSSKSELFCLIWSFVILHFGFRWLFLKHHRTLLAILGKGWYSHKIVLDFVEILEITFVPWAKEEEKCPPVVRESSEQIISLEGTEHRFPPPSPHQGAHIKYKHISSQIQIQNYIYLQICKYSSTTSHHCTLQCAPRWTLDKTLTKIHVPIIYTERVKWVSHKTKLSVNCW